MNNLIQYLEQLNQNPNFTKEEKSQIINEVFSNYRKQVDSDLNKYLTKQYTGAALQIGSAIPMGSAARVGAEVIGKPLTKYVGRKIAQNIGGAAAAGNVSSGLFGIGQGLMNDKNPYFSGLQSATEGTLFGTALGGSTGKLKQLYDANQLKNSLNNTNRFKNINQYYRDYEQGHNITRSDIGLIKLVSDGFKETNRQSPRYSNEVIGLSKNLQNAEYIGVEQPQHVHKYDITQFHRLRGKNADYLVAENAKGNKYFHKVASPGIAGPKPEAQSLPQDIITDNASKVNPQGRNITLKGYISNTSDQSQFAGYVNPLTGDNHIYTRQEIDSMSPDEYVKNEKEIFAQLNSKIGIPHEADLQNDVSSPNAGTVYVNSYTRADGTKVKGYYRSR